MPDLVRMMVSEVNVAVPAGPGVEAGVVMLTEVDEPCRRLRIVIGQPEARAIQAAWTGAVPSRPSTWDLMVSAVAMLDARLDRAVITSVFEDRHFFASLEFERDGVRRTLACRPSDAVALALRAYGAEIYAEAEVLDSAGLGHDGTKFGAWPKAPDPEVPAAGPDEPTVVQAAVAPSPADEPTVVQAAVPSSPADEPTVVQAAPVPEAGPVTEAPPTSKPPT